LGRGLGYPELLTAGFADSNANGTPGQLGDDWNILTEGFDAANYLTWYSVQAGVNGGIEITNAPIFNPTEIFVDRQGMGGTPRGGPCGHLQD